MFSFGWQQGHEICKRLLREFQRCFFNFIFPFPMQWPSSLCLFSSLSSLWFPIFLPAIPSLSLPFSLLLFLCSFLASNFILFLFPVECWGAGVVICLEWGADLYIAQLMPLPLTVSCFTKIPIDFTFLLSADLGSPGKRAVKRVCVCACLFPFLPFMHYAKCCNCWAVVVFSFVWMKHFLQYFICNFL